MWQSRGLKGPVQVVSYLEELEVIEATFVGFESATDCLHLSPDVDEGFRLSGSRDTLPWIENPLLSSLPHIRERVKTY